MGKRLCVILGAGASHDLIANQTAVVRPEYEPPLAADLFKYRESFQGILEKYKGAKSLAATIGIRVQGGQPLESVLRALADSTERHIVRQFQQVPLYLQELIATVSRYYTSEPVNHTYLMNETVGCTFDKVAFVTLNYDMFLEQALSAVDGSTFKQLRSYVDANRNWMLIKLHGSVGWGRQIAADLSGEMSHERMLDLLDGVILKEVPLGELRLLQNPSQRWDGKGLLYPALSIPVQGKYGFVCPDDHVGALRDFLRSCANYLVIGVSGRDRDLLDLLSGDVKSCEQLAIVGGPDVVDVTKRFFDAVTAFRFAAYKSSSITYNGGFSAFLVSGAFEEFLARLN